jgi:precorrin-3B methylase
MTDILHQNLDTVQSDKQPLPVTIASAATIAPTTLLSLITGTTNISTVTPPVTGTHLLVLKFTNSSPGDLVTGGNITRAVTTIAQNDYVLLLYNPIAKQYDPIVEDTLASV